MAGTREQPFDLFIVGGGINGAGIANDAAGRGLNVGLCEMADFAGATSSASTKLIHGGLRYLEYYEFRLVRESLAEREVLLRKAPHIIWPLRFVLPHEPHLRPSWMIRIGLFLYDRLGGRMSLPKSKGVKLAGTPWGVGLAERYTKGFVYSDCWVDDARLVIFNLMQAREKGATILPRTQCLAASRDGELWRVSLRDLQSGQEREIFARGLVNAAGPWVRHLFDALSGVKPGNNVRLVKGSHIVVPRQHAGEHAFILQNRDNRIVFVIPYQNDYTLIGTTDVPYQGEPRDVKITNEEIDYLCAIASDYLARPVTPKDVVWTYSGVRPLYDDGSDNPSAVTRDYVFELDAANEATPLLSVYGGKITTYRELAERALHKLKPFYPAMGPDWTAQGPLPGGDLGLEFEAFVGALVTRHPALPPDYLRTLARRHGSHANRILDGAHRPEDLGRHFGGALYEREVDWLMRQEWAIEAPDVLWRRTKEGLRLDEGQRQALSEWMAAHRRNRL
ncbi:MAG: glycerol-3-phosphate dehydrogenase [Alphaproteobacteria bacterium]|nr:glycerol-3-phosphate dehydrogenase [Alphaproteobacteria bacterium]